MWSKIYMKKNQPSNNGSISNIFMPGSVYFFPSPLFSSHAELQNYIHQKHYNRTADIAYSTSDLFAAPVHYTGSTYVSNLIVLAVHTLELNLIYCMFRLFYTPSGLFHSTAYNINTAER